MKITLDQLEVLDTIDRCGSFTAAAKELGRATSALSYAVRTLEESLGLELFDRSGRRSVLTAGGRLILDEARGVVRNARHLETVAGQLRSGWEPTLGIVIDGAFPLAPVMQALKRFSTAGVPTKVRLRVEYLSGVAERFERDGADLMLTLGFERDSRLAATPLPAIEFVLLAHADHPVHATPSPRDRALLGSYVELLVEDSGEGPAARPPELLLHGTQVFRFSDFHTKREALLGGVGLGWMPRHLAERQLADRRLLQVGFEEGDTHRFPAYLVHRRDAGPGRAAGLLRSHLLEAFGVG